MNSLFEKRKMFKRLLSVLLTVVVLVTSLGLDQLAMTARAVTTYTTIYFKDETESHWVGNDGAVIEMVDNTYGHTSYMMKKLNSTTWSVKVPAYVFNVTFNRLSPSGKQWNSWSAGGRGKKRSDRSTWSSTYHTTVPEHGYWDGTAEFIEGFHEGDVIYLDYYEFQQWEIVDTSYYVNFTNAMKKHTIKIDEENVEEYKPILLTNEIEDMVYTYTVTAEDEGAPELRFWRGSGSELWNASVVLKYSDYLEGNNCVKVQGWTDTGYVCPYVPRRHVPVIDKTSLEVLGNKKVNRKIAINLDIQGETEYLSLEDTEINIQKLDSNGNVLADEKEENYLIYDTDATEWNHRELLFKQSGSYKVSTITYSRDKVDCYTTEEIINIVEDNAPVAEIDFVNADTDQKGKDTENVFVRNKEGKCNLKIKDQSVSEINDEITSREYKVFYDKNNDGKYSENEVMENVNGNKMEFTIALKKVGKYQVIETVKETFSDTIEKLLTEEDYLSGNVVVDFEIVNQAPVSSMDVKKGKIADIVFTVGSVKKDVLEKYSAITAGVKERIEKLGIEAKVSTIASSELTAIDTFAWDEYDHYNWSDRYLPALSKHILYEEKDIKMVGYSRDPIKDFLYVEDYDSEKKIFEFDLEKDSTDWHSMEGGGFLFNTSISKDKDGNKKIQGYCVLFVRENNKNAIKLVQINETDLNNFMNGKYSYVQNAGKLLQRTYVSDGNNSRHWRIITDENTITVYDGDNFDPVIDNFVLPENSVKAYGYGPITSHGSHACSQRSFFTFKNITMTTIKGESLSDVVNKHEWTPGDNHYVVSLSENNVPELVDDNRMSEVAAALISNNVSFYGIGKDKIMNRYNALLNAIDGTGENIQIGKIPSISENDDSTEITVEDAIDQVVARIVADVNSKDYEIKDIISSDEKVEYVDTFYDCDGDQKGEEVWNYEYNPSVFDENDGKIQNITCKSPIEMFEKTGAYTITHKVSDDLTENGEEQSVFSLWSDEDNYMKLILSQHRPVAEISVNMSYTSTKTCAVNVQYSAYDEDHMTDAKKGIRKEEFYYKQINDSQWTEGKFPSKVDMGTTYLIKYVVTDVEGTKSRPKVVAVKTKEAQRYVRPNDTNPPTISLAVSDEIVELGSKFYVEASAEDDYGVSSFSVTYGKEKIGTGYGRYECVANQVGEYTITVVATDIVGNKSTETKKVTVIDTTDVAPPTIEITSPVNGSISGATDIIGTIKDDKKLKSYKVTRTTVSLEGKEGTVDADAKVIASGTEEIIDGTIATIETEKLASGVYCYEVSAEDAAGHVSTMSCVVTVTEEKYDRIAPEANISGITLDNESSIIVVYGNVSDDIAVAKYELYVQKNEDSEEVLIGSGESAVSEAILGTLSTVGLESGEYSLKLVATDTTGNTCTSAAGFSYEKGNDSDDNQDTEKSEVVVNPDLTAPVILVDLKATIEDGKLKINAAGTIDDENLASYKVITGKLDADGEIADSHNIASGSASVKDKEIIDYTYDSYEEGQYGVHINAVDEAGNSRTTKYIVTVNSKGLVEQGYSGENDQKKDDNGDGDKEQINKDSLLNLALSRTIADIGSTVNAYYTYPKSATDVKITADGANVTMSDKSAVITSSNAGEVEVVLHATIDGEKKTIKKVVRFFDRSDCVHPTVEFVSPEADSELSNLTDIYANIYDETSLAYYILEYKMAGGDGEYIELARGTKAIKNSKVGELDATKLLNGCYILRITAVDNGGNLVTTQRTVEVTGNLKIGNMSIGFKDINANVAGIPLTVTRNYDSRNKNSGDFGYGWTMGIQSAKIAETNPITEGYSLVQSGSRLSTCYTMTQTVKHDVVVTYGDGTCDRFELKVSPERSALIPIREVSVKFLCTTDKRVKLELAKDSHASIYGSQLIFDDFEFSDNNSYVLTKADGTKLYLNTAYGLTKMEDANGNTVSITKSGYKHSTGNSVLFTRDANGHVTKATEKNASGKVISEFTYEYSDKGDLVAVTDTMGRKVTFTYDNEHNMIDIIDPSGAAVARNIYDDDGRLLQTIDENGDVTEYEHNLDERAEVVRDKMGNTTVSYYDENGNVTKTVDALGNKEEFTYDANNKVTSKKDALGNVTKYDYDENSQLSTLTTADGKVEKVSYNQLNLVTGINLAGQEIAMFDYDNKGNLTKAEDSLGNVTEMDYDKTGKLLGVADEIGTVHSLTYNTAGNLVSSADGNGNVTKYVYDAQGKCTSVVVKRTGEDGVAREYRSRYTYDKAGNITSVVSPSGDVVTYQYDFRNNKISSKDYDGKTTLYTYDNQNNLTKVTYPDGTAEEFTYDKNGNAITATSRMGVTVTNAYDKLNRLVKKTYADGTNESYTYDANGNVLTHTLVSGGVMKYTYDCMNRNTSVTDAYGNVTTFEYNERSLLTKQTDALGNVFTYDYDANGNQVKATYPDGTVEESEYDARNRVVASIDRNGNKTTYTYDTADNLIGVKDANGEQYTYCYDETYELTKVVDANNNTTSYTYDADGRVIKVTNAEGKSYAFSYTRNGYQTGYTDYAGVKTQYAYDKNRRITKVTNKDGATNFTYDALGRLEKVADKNGTISYTYDKYSRIHSKTTYDYGTITYSYDANGEISKVETSVKDKVVNATSYKYDLMDRLVRVVGHDGSVTLYEYDAIGNRTKVKHEGGITVSYQYDTCSRLEKETVTDTDGSVLMYYGYTYGKAGEKLSATEVVRDSADDTDARVTYTEYGYDKLLRITNEEISVKDKVVISDIDFSKINQIKWSGSLTYKYAYDAVSNRLSKEAEVEGDVCGLDQDVLVGTTKYTYNTINQLTTAEFTDSEKNDTITTEYRYDANGNLVSEHSQDVDKTYTYNGSNQLITATISKGNDVTIESYGYDFEGNRITKQINEGAKVYYLNDTIDALTQVSLELEKTENNEYQVNKYYTRGTELISVGIKTDASNNYVRKVYLMDGHGSVTALAETETNKQSGKSVNKITDTYTYDAYGNLLRKTGETENDYLYTGEQYNANTELYYLRARYMSPETGSFISMDTYAGTLDNPVSLHKYLYANANPVMYTDPTGYFSLAECSVANAIRSNLDSMRTYINVKKIMSWANMAVTMYDVAQQAQLIMAGEANILGLAVALAKGMLTQALLNCVLTAALGEAAATVVKLLGVAQDAGSFIDAVKSGDPERIIVESVRLAVSFFTLKCQCFTGDTLVSTEDGSRRIDDIQVGDKIWAYNTETGEKELKEVLATPVTETDILVHVTLADGEQIDTTMFHPFYVQNEKEALGTWTAASNLVSGDKLLMENGQSVYVESIQIEKLEKAIKVYNLEIEGLHTYFVGNGVLVHNECEVIGGGHGSPRHKSAIQDKIDELSKEPDVITIYGNRSLNSANLVGNQRPDITVVRKQGDILVYEIYEYASKSQATGTSAYRKLKEKMLVMEKNNPSKNNLSVIIKDLIEWGTY